MGIVGTGILGSWETSFRLTLRRVEYASNRRFSEVKVDSTEVSMLVRKVVMRDWEAGGRCVH